MKKLFSNQICLCILCFVLGVVIALVSVLFVVKKEYKGNYLVDNYCKIIKTERMIKDKKSRDLYRAYINFLSYRIEIPQKFNSEYPESFFPKTLPENGDIVIDAGVGAFNGKAMAPFLDYAEMVGAKGFVYGFEPVPQYAKEIEQNIKVDGYKNAKIYPYGVWSENTTMDLYLGELASSLVLPCYDNPPTVKVKLVSLDSFVEENNIKKVDLIKMDIEGAEAEALKGAENIIRQHKPKLVLAIYHKPDDFFNIIAYLNSLNPNYSYYLENHGPYETSADWLNRRNIMLYAVDETKEL